MRTRTIALSVFALVMALGGPARADATSSAAAQALFEEGRGHLQQGRYQEACDRLARSDALDPAVGTRLSLGECHERLGHVASAWAAYNDGAALALQRRDAARAEVAKRRADALEPRLARLTIHVPPGAGVVVTRNGVRVDPAALGAAVPVDAGIQRIEASAPGREPWRTELAMRDGQAAEVRVPPLAAVPAPPPSIAVEDAPHESSQRTLALGLEVGGGVALLGGLVFGGLAMSKWATIEDACPDGHCPSEAERRRLAPEASTATTLATVSTVTTGIGVAALAAGIVLHVTAPSTSVAVVPMAAPSAAGLAGVARF